MTNYKASEWDELISMPIGGTKMLSDFTITRVPAGVIYRYELREVQTSYINNHTTSSDSIIIPNNQLGMVFCPFPPGLVEKLNGL